MTTSPATLRWTDVLALPASGTLGWVSRAVLPLARGELPFELLASGDGPPRRPPDTLVVVGGGTLIDRAKLWRRDQAPSTRLVAVPSLWGSGADATAIAVTNEGGRKVIAMGDGLLPDARAVWPELAAHVPPALGRPGYGDAWSHALEGFLSPLADDALRQRAAGFIGGPLLDAALSPSPAWFDLAAEAAALQAASGVGLVHGIAHQLEPGSRLGHAEWCSLMLWPVMRFNLANSRPVREKLSAHALPWERIEGRLRELHDPAAFDAALPLLRERWTAVLRDPLTRINAALVRPASLAYFEERRFHEPAA